MMCKTLGWKDSKESVYVVVARLGRRLRRFYFAEVDDAQEKWRELTQSGVDKVRVELLCGH